jgi:hypothetical protein
MHYIEGGWIVDTQYLPQQMLHLLRPRLDPNDLILIVPASNQYQGLLPKEAWDWPNNRPHF